ncbi:MAG: hypothetical protein ACI9VS_001950 [Candidatus Binatia bacterium]|jgi:hypothetical protein
MQERGNGVRAHAHNRQKSRIAIIDEFETASIARRVNPLGHGLALVGWFVRRGQSHAPDQRHSRGNRERRCYPFLSGSHRSVIAWSGAVGRMGGLEESI